MKMFIDISVLYFKNQDSVLLSHEGDDFLPRLLITKTLHKY